MPCQKAAREAGKYATMFQILCERIGREEMTSAEASLAAQRAFDDVVLLPVKQRIQQVSEAEQRQLTP